MVDLEEHTRFVYNQFIYTQKLKLKLGDGVSRRCQTFPDVSGIQIKLS